MKILLPRRCAQRSGSEAKALYAIKEFFGCGVVKTDNKKTNTLKKEIKFVSVVIKKLVLF